MHVNIGDYDLNYHNPYGPPCLVPSPSMEKTLDFRQYLDKSKDNTLSAQETCAVHIHGYYMDELWGIMDILKDCLNNFDLFITTNSLEKKEVISEHLRRHPLGCCARMWIVIQTPDRGRNVGPLLIDIFNQISGYECVLHMHSKRSEHWGSRSLVWTQHLHQNLAGSTELVGDIRTAFQTDPQLGLLMPQTSTEVRYCVHWGQNFSVARIILQGISPDQNLCIDAPLIFPVGMMFWFRPRALAKLSEACKKLQPLPLEPLPLDGSPLHAIERLVAHSCEASGYRWQLICDEKPNDERQYQHKPMSILSPLTETYIQACSLLGVEMRRLQAHMKQAEQEHKQIAAMLEDTERLRISLEEDHAQTLITLDQVRYESHQNWLIAMEIVNSRIWNSTRFIRKIKDRFRQKATT